MTQSADAGVLIYAKHLALVATFYERVLGAITLHADAEHRVLQADGAQLVIHAIPAAYAAAVEIATPPVPREEQAIKPFFTVADLAEAEQVVVETGGVIYGPIWPGPGMRVRNVCDPEGNIIHLRQRDA